MKSRVTPVWFALRFLVCFALLIGAFEASRGTAFERFVVENLILVPSVHVINLMAPQDHAELVGRVITSPRSRLNVTRGCEGIEMFLLLVAAIAAFPASPSYRIFGLMAGSALAYVLSITRLVALHFVLSYSPRAWEALHGLVLPLLPILLVSLFFMHWATRATRARGTDADAHPA
jgi:exosortase family protein XrtM